MGAIMRRETIWILLVLALLLGAQFAVYFGLERTSETWAPAMEHPSGSYYPLPPAMRPR